SSAAAPVAFRGRRRGARPGGISEFAAAHSVKHNKRAAWVRLRGSRPGSKILAKLHPTLRPRQLASNKKALQIGGRDNCEIKGGHQCEPNGPHGRQSGCRSRGNLKPSTTVAVTGD